MFLFNYSFLCKPLCFRDRVSLISNKNLQKKIQNLYYLSISVSEKSGGNSIKFRQESQRCLKKLVSIMHSSSRNQIRTLDPRTIISCTIKIFSLFEDTSHDHCHSLCQWNWFWNHQTTTICYRFLLATFASVKPKKLIAAVLDNIINEKLWKFEENCYAIVLDMLKFNVSGFLIAKYLCNKIQSNNTDFQDAQEISRILIRLLEVYKWPQSKETNVFIHRLLKIYQMNLSQVSEKTKLMSMTKKLEMCVKLVVENVMNENLLIALQYMCSWIVKTSNIEDAVILNYGNLLEHVAARHKTKLLTHSLTSDLFPLLVTMISSPNKLVNLLGNRLLQHLLDRKGSKLHFNTPKLFFKDEPTDLVIGECLHDDKIFFKTHREVIHDCIIKSIVNHCRKRVNLESTYCTICLFAVEVPCGFAAAALVCLAMNMQDMMLEDENLPRETGYHIHSTVVAVMSLLCWIHNAKVFFEYVNKIFLERMQWAPHLNPPLFLHYEHAEHDVLWNKPELFFVDWEVRFGLWKRFRLHNEDRRVSGLMEN